MSKSKALDAYMATFAEVETMVAKLNELTANHFEVAPDDVDWGHVGTLKHRAELLKQVLGETA